MKKFLWTSWIGLSAVTLIWAQDTPLDSVSSVQLQEVIIINTAANTKNQKASASIESYLQEGKNIDMIQRGGYAWEPILHNMPMERSSLTIDGMHIFNACTDKMDPITSYVETSNLKRATIRSGQQGSMYGPTIGGGIDLQTQRATFTPEAHSRFGLQTGYESNNQLQVYGGNASFSNSKWYINTNLMYRDAENYKAGGNETILYSQYRKLNAAGTIGYALSDSQTLEANLIYDKATDVGYPALPMDVSLAEALIASLRYEIRPINSWVTAWDTKIYYNTITHRMDDTKRPPETLAMHMDMPGWSDTFGVYSTIKGTYENHHLSTTINSFYNKSLAEMTMYPKDPNEKLMFLRTWPDIHTNYTGLHIQDHWELDNSKSFLFSASLGNHYNQVKNMTGLQIFYPEMDDNKSRLLASAAANFNVQEKKWGYGFGLAFGQRAPSVSEGYGYYLFNSSDKYDYLGNPNLKTEQSFEVNSFIAYNTTNVNTKISASLFHLNNYIIGTIMPGFPAMTPAAIGMKQYNNLDYAQMLSLDWHTTYALTDQWLLKAGLSYHYGEDHTHNPLPLISPLAYDASISYNYKDFDTSLKLQGNALKTNIGKNYGEEPTAAYAILNWIGSYQWYFNRHQLSLNAGVENIFDTYYTTYSDWNHLPRSGRNLFVNLNYHF